MRCESCGWCVWSTLTIEGAEMAKSTQAKLADWTLAGGISSMVLPFVALFLLGGFGSRPGQWFQLAGLVVLAGASFWMLSLSAKD